MSTPEELLSHANPETATTASAGAVAASPEELPAVAWSYVPSDVWADVVYTDDPEKVKLAREYGREVTQLTDHATATATITKLRTELEASRLECEMLRVDAERYKIAKMRLYKDGATLNAEIGVLDGYAIGHYSEACDALLDAAIKRIAHD